MKYTIDSRTVEAGDIFIPVKGANYDGHDFIDEAISKGAAVIDQPLIQVAARHREKFILPIIAISGSCGKTTLKEMLAHILSLKYNVVKNDKNFNNEIGVPLTLLKINQESQIAVIEIGSRHQGDIAKLIEIIKPTDSCLTNIGVAHLDIFGSRDNIAQAKAEIIYPNSRFFLNTDIDYKDLLINKALANNCQIIEYRAENKFFQNQAAAFKIAQAYGISEQQCRQALQTFSGSGHRLKLLKNQQNFLVIDDCYNSNPNSLQYLLDYCDNYFTSTKKLFILADMLELGTESIRLHKMIEVGKNDILVTLGNYSAQIQGGKSHHHFQNKIELINSLQELINDVDLVAIKGSRYFELETVVDFLKDLKNLKHLECLEK